MSEKRKVSWVSVVVIVTAVAVVAILGSNFSERGEWYSNLNKPSIQPPDWVFPIVWNTIFILAVLSLVLVWNSKPHTKRTYWFIGIALLNGAMNVAWSFFFFERHMIRVAVWDAAAICASVIAMIITSWRISRFAALLFVPYAVWTAFATYLTWEIMQLNP